MTAPTPTPEERAAKIGPCGRWNATINGCDCRWDKAVKAPHGGVICADIVAAIREAESDALERAAVLLARQSIDKFGGSLQRAIAIRTELADAIRAMKKETGNG